MGVGILAKRVVLELGSSTNFVYSLTGRALYPCRFFCSGKNMKKREKKDMSEMQKPEMG